MQGDSQPDEMRGYSNVSTGRLPRDERVQALVQAAHDLYQSNDDGQNAAQYPALAQVSRELFGTCIVSADGKKFSAGDATVPFTIMSVSKPFIFALVLQALGKQEAREKLGVNSTGLPFNSLMAIEMHPTRTGNPMVNAGAIAATSLVPGESSEEKWQSVLQGLSRFAGRELSVNEEVYASASATNQRNQAVARLLESYSRIYFDPAATVDLYTRQCSLNVTAVDLAVMAATLADGGVNPLTRDVVIDAAHCPQVLAVMATAGMYETSGDWLYDIGLPGKSGIGGGIITVAPGKGGLGVFSPPLDESGNSVRGQLATKYLSHALGLNLFASEPVV